MFEKGKYLLLDKITRLIFALDINQSIKYINKLPQSLMDFVKSKKP